MNETTPQPVPKSHFARVADAWTRERPDLDLKNFLLAIALMRVGRMIDHAYAKMRVLLALRRAGRPFALRPTDLFTALLISSGAITKQVDRLAAKQLVTRLEDPSHGGGFLIQLTREGLKVTNTATDILASESLLNPIMAKLPAHERAAGEAFSRFVVAELEAMHVMDPDEAGDSDAGSAAPGPRPKVESGGRKRTRGRTTVET
jgi:DNA-binding MarR family transcriptional regulator